jgi:mRNA degradation ribonuclease J1/J2
LFPRKHHETRSHNPDFQQPARWKVVRSCSRILLDLGLPLDAKDLASTPLPKIEGLAEGSSTLLAIVLSHGHRDHWGLIPKVSPQIPLVMGRATECIIRAAADFVPDAVKLNAAQYLEHGKPIQLGPFTVLPRLVDHSGFDAYAMEVQADGKRLFYSGALISIAAPCHGRSIVRERSTKVFGENLRELVAEAATSAASLQVPCSGFWRTPTPRILLQDHSD